MQVKDLKAKTGNVSLRLQIIEKAAPRSFDKFGKSGKVANAKGKDATGTITLTLWNDDVDAVNVGDTIEIENGWVGEYQGELQLSTGKFGKLEVVEKAASLTTESPVSAKSEPVVSKPEPITPPKPSPVVAPKVQPPEPDESPITDEEFIQ